MKREEIIDLLTRARLSPFGIKVSTSDPNKLRQKLYAVRKANEEYSNLSFVIPAATPDDILFIIAKPETPNAPTEE